MSDRENEPIWDAQDPSEATLDAMLTSADDGMLRAIRRSLDLDAGLAQIIGQPPVQETFLSVSDPGDTLTSKHHPAASRAGYPFPGAAHSRYMHQPSPGEQAMARRSFTTRGNKPDKPISYGLLARLADRRAGRSDGRAGVPVLPVISAEATGTHAGTTPYLEIRRRHFLDWAEREHHRMLTDLADTYRMRAEVRQKIVGANEQTAAVRKLLESIPEIPAEAVLVSRNVVEQHIHEAAVRARRQREHYAMRAEVLAQERQVVEEIRALRVEEARLAGMIIASEQILDARIRQLYEYSMRRCATYVHHLVRNHSDGPALIPFLHLALPTLPEWSGRRDPGAEPPMASPDIKPPGRGG